MALTRPTLTAQSAFDATSAHVFTFNVVGGDQVVANRLVILNNTTGAEVYNQRQTTYTFTHNVPANTLENGTYYNAYLVTYNSTNVESVESNYIDFYCYTTPEISITNIPSGNIISNSSFTFNGLYNQVEGELLNGYLYNLYNSSQSLIASSGNQFVTGTPPVTTVYTFSGFDNESTYYIELRGQTINNTQVTTGLIQFQVQYSQPIAYGVLNLTNNCSEGYIEIRSLLVSIEGESNPSPPVYIDDKEIDLRIEDSYVKWNEGYTITGDFSVQIWGRDFNAGKTILIFTADDGETIKIHYYETGSDAFFDITSSNNGLAYTIQTNYLPIPSSTQGITCYFKRIGRLFTGKASYYS